jgi:hypothetical protein
MSKEIVLAIIAGIGVGVIFAFVIWKANSTVQPQTEQTENISISSPTPGFFEESNSLLITTPEENSIITTKSTMVVGMTTPNTLITISTLQYDYLTYSDAARGFEKEIELKPGINRILASTLDEEGTTRESTLTFVMSEEFSESMQEYE